MGRKKRNHAYNYFQLSESIQNTSKCIVCEKIVKGQHGSNLLKHLKIHPSIYELVIKKNNDYSSALPVNKNKKVEMSAINNTVLKECVNLTTVHGRPFTLVDDKAFQNLISLIPGQQNVNSKKVKESVSATADALRKEICSEFKNKLISLKVDASTLGTRCFLGINIQYALEDKIMVRNLSVTELYARHTGEYLAENVLATLNRYHICTYQIYCCTTDNGANMLRMTKILQENMSSTFNDPLWDSNTNDYTISDNESGSETETEPEDDLIDPERFQDNLNNALTTSLDDYCIPAVRCAAHTLQLAVRDACLDSDIQDLIKLVRDLVKKLRTQNYAMFLKASGRKKPLLDCPTRWGSTFDMLERFLTLNEVISGEPNNDLFFPTEKWPILENVIKSLKPAKVLTKRLQTEQLTIGDFYGDWLKCQLENDDINTSLSKTINQKMKERQTLLFGNEAFVSAIYLDPRFNSILTPEQQVTARDHLIKTYRRMITLEKRNLGEDEEDIASTSAVPNDSNVDIDTPQSAASTISTDNKLRDYMTTKYLETHDPSQSASTISQTDRLKDLLIIFLDEPLLDYSVNIFHFWQTKKSSFPVLYKLSQIVLSAPATQVSVERLFSSLKFVVSHLRMSLKDDLVDDIVFIRNNSVK